MTKRMIQIRGWCKTCNSRVQFDIEVGEALRLGQVLLSEGHDCIVRMVADIVEDCRVRQVPIPAPPDSSGGSPDLAPPVGGATQSEGGDG